MPGDRTRRGLNGLNFCVAAVQTGFGPFIAVFLTEQGWRPTSIGVALSVGTLAAMASQLPAGALVDHVPSKRLAAAAALLGLGASALVLALWPAWSPVMGAEIVHGFASCMVGPAVAAITLGVFGHVGLGERLGGNARWASIGNAVAAAVMGACGSYWSSRAVLVLTAALAVPAIGTLSLISPAARAPVDPATSHAALLPAAQRRQQHGAARIWDLFRDRGLLIFAACAGLFFLGNAAMLPLAANALSISDPGQVSFLVSASIVVPQAIVALASPWVGRMAERAGRRPVLLLGFAALPLRGLLLALLPGPYFLVPIQALDGISGAVFGVMVPLLAADITRRTGSLNLGMGAINLAIGLGASISTTLAGTIAQTAGNRAAFLVLAGAGACATLLLWQMMPETRPKSRAPHTAVPATARGIPL